MLEHPVDSTNQNQFVSKLLNYWPLLALGLLAALMLLWKLGDSSLFDYDEAIYAQVAKEIVQGGDWLTLHWGYKPWFHKPPLLMWTTAVFYRLFGVSEFWARAAAAFSGIGIIFITYAIGQRLYNSFVGFFAAVVLLTNHMFVGWARHGATDTTLTLFVYLAIYAYLSLREGKQKYWYLIWISCALAVMVKGPAGVIAPATIALALLFDKRLVATLQSRHFWQGLVFAFVIVAPWHLYMYLQHGRSFVDEYLGYHIIARSTQALEGNAGGKFYYVEHLRQQFFPWVYLIPFALALSIKENIKGQVQSRILLLVTVVVFGLYTIVQTKLPWYVFPIYPALAILIAAVVVQAIRFYDSTEFSALAVAACVVALNVPVKIVLICACVGLLIAIISFFIKKNIYQPAAIVMAAFFVIAGLSTLTKVYNRGETAIAKLARIAGGTVAEPQEPLIILRKKTFDLYQPAPLFYSNRPIKEAYSLSDLAEFTGDHQTKKIILEENVNALPTAYEFHQLAKAEPFVYGMIKLGQTPSPEAKN